MDAYEATKMVFSRIQALDSDNAATVMGVLLIQDPGEQEMIRLAFGPDSLLRAVIAESLQKQQPAAAPPAASIPFFPTAAAAAPPFDFDDDQLCGLHNAVVGPRGAAAADHGTGGRCLYFSRGYCKNGPGCRFMHHGTNYSSDGDNDDYHHTQLHHQPNYNRATLLGSLRLSPAAQQLTPSPPTAAAPFSMPSPKSLTALSHLRLQQLHHQRRQQLLLQRAEDEEAAAAAATTLRLLNMRGAQAIYSPDMLSPASRQIYLTFPADSTFTEEDVSNYFSIYGPVQDVRIPYQQKRMFGFVSFVYPETVRMVLAKGNPHFVCDSRVLVKPYKEKPKLRDNTRKPLMAMMSERSDFDGCGIDDTGYHQIGFHPLEGSRMALGGSQEAAVLLRRKVEEEQQAAAALHQAIEFQRKRFTGLQMLDLNNHRDVSHSPKPIFSTPTGTTPSGLPGPATAHNHHHYHHPPCNGTVEEAKCFAAESDKLAPEATLHPGETGATSDSEVDVSDMFKGTPDVLHTEEDTKYASDPTLSEAAHGGRSGLHEAEGRITEESCLFGSSEHDLLQRQLPSPVRASSLIHKSLATTSEEMESLNPRPPSSIAAVKPCFQMPRFSAGRGALGI